MGSDPLITNALIGTNPKPGIGKLDVRTSMSDAALYELTMPSPSVKGSERQTAARTGFA
jgi:hypothetical protein